MNLLKYASTTFLASARARKTSQKVLTFPGKGGQQYIVTESKVG